MWVYIAMTVVLMQIIWIGMTLCHFGEPTQVYVIVCCDLGLGGDNVQWPFKSNQIKSNQK